MINWYYVLQSKSHFIGVLYILNFCFHIHVINKNCLICSFSLTLIHGRGSLWLKSNNLVECHSLLWLLGSSIIWSYDLSLHGYCKDERWAAFIILWLMYDYFMINVWLFYDCITTPRRNRLCEMIHAFPFLPNITKSMDLKLKLKSITLRIHVFDLISQ